MKLLKLNLLTCIFLTMGFTIINAQNIEYYYDNAGNRIERVIILQIPSYTPQIPQEETVIEDIVSEYSIKIYPNPTKGHLAMEIINAPSVMDGSMILYNSGGQMLANSIITSSYTTFDLSGHIPGIYILHIRINEEIITWKIVKE